jgi:ssDNA thymidine ADP-ribosyltransferase, DarT
MLDLNEMYLYRMTHIENIPHILQHGITHLSSPNANPNFVPIGDKSLISTRNDFILNNGKRLGDYIPFYFSVRTPMLYVVQHGYNMVAPTPAENIIYCRCSIQDILDLKLDFVFTDGHAVDGFSTQYIPENIPDIQSLLDMKAIDDKYWRDENDLDKKRRKEAEFLVLGDIPIPTNLDYFVFNPQAKEKLINFGANPKNVQTKHEYYF